MALSILLGLVYIPDLNAQESDGNSEIQAIFSRIKAHDFHPLNEESSFTFDNSLNTAGIANLDNEDWKIRLLGVRDLLLLGQNNVEGLIQGLNDDNAQVRYVCAMVLGMLRPELSISPLETFLRQDSSSIVRSQAVISLGQLESEKSLPLLRDRFKTDTSRDVRHQCELAIDQIEKKMGATDQLMSAFMELNESSFEILKIGETAPDFELEDTEGMLWNLSDFRKKKWVVLIWVFADWCPVCHGEFNELFNLKTTFERENIQVFTLECHDRYRGRVMVGKELDPEYWFSKKSFKEEYTKRIWWPHLLDRGGSVAAQFGVDPLAFAVHSEYVNRPATIIIDPEGKVRFAYYGTYWGDRPSIKETLEMIQMKNFRFEHPKRLKLKN